MIAVELARAYGDKAEIAVTTTAADVFSGLSPPTNALIVNVGSSVVYLSGTAAGPGAPLARKQSFAVRYSGQPLYARTVAGTGRLRLIHDSRGLDFPPRLAGDDLSSVETTLSTLAATAATMNASLDAIESESSSIDNRLTALNTTAVAIHGIIDDEHTDATSSKRVEEIDPVSGHYVSETVADVTDGSDGLNNYYIDMNGYRDLGCQLILDGGSGTIYVAFFATFQDDGTAAGSCSYQVVTKQWYGASAFYDDIYVAPNTTETMAHYVRVSVGAISGSDDADWKIFCKKLY